MKFLILLVILTGSAMANVADIRCNLNGPIVINGTWGAVRFNQAEIVINNLDKEVRSASMYIQDRFGSNYENFFRLWQDRTRCSSNSTCISTDFSSLRGLTVTMPNEVFEKDRFSFNTRVRSNSNRRTHFANCRSTLR